MARKKKAEEPEPMSLAAMTKVYASLTLKKREYQGLVDAVNNELTSMEKVIIDTMIAQGISSLKVDTLEGAYAVTLTPWLSPKVTDWPLAIKALKKEGLGDLVETKVNLNRLRSAIKELIASGHRFKKGFDEAIEIDEFNKLSVTKAKGAKKLGAKK